MSSILSRRGVSITLKTLVTIGLLAGLLYYIDSDEIMNSISQADPVLLSLGSVLVVANTGIHFLRWRYLLRLVSRDVSNADVFTSLLVGFSAGFFTPGQVGEIVGRIAGHPDLRKSHIIGITIIDKVYILAVTAATGIGSLAVFCSLFYPQYWSLLFSLLIVIFIAAVALLMVAPERIMPLLKRLPGKIRDHRYFSVIGIIEQTFHNRHARMVSVLSVSLYAVIVVQFYIFINAFSDVALFDTAISTLSVYFIKAVVLPISIGDLGVRESASVFFFSKFGVPAASAFNASVCMFIVNVLLPSIVGAVLILKLKLK
jgi:uncharacterized protein (TIRG00374 family)